jgi:pimeloyl-ACP methyl ester carboxylesterase
VRGSQGTFTYADRRLAYTRYGDGPRLVVLLHGLLFSCRMHDELGRTLARACVVTLDLHGHGESDRPRDMWRYSMP